MLGQSGARGAGLPRRPRCHRMPFPDQATAAREGRIEWVVNLRMGAAAPDLERPHAAAPSTSHKDGDPRCANCPIPHCEYHVQRCPRRRRTERPGYSDIPIRR